MPKTASHAKPVLVRMGDHYIDPKDVTGFKQAKKGLYIIQLRSCPEPEFPLWLSEREMEAALEYFQVEGLEL